MKLEILDTLKLASLADVELQRKKIETDGLKYFCAYTGEQQVNTVILDVAELQTRSKFAWLPKNSSLTPFSTRKQPPYVNQI